MQYLVCPEDEGELSLDTARADLVSEGEFTCSRCGSNYPIRNGVPYFFDSVDGFNWGNRDADGISGSIEETINDDKFTWLKIVSLASLFLSRLKDRKKAIDAIFYMTQTVSSSIDSEEKMAFLMQAATAARYEIEIYRGTFTLPREIIDFLRKNFQQGIVVEGACASGECLLELTQSLPSGFYLGLDISGNQARIGQRSARENVLFVQGNICSLPIRENSAGLYLLNNVFDRVVNPKEAALQAGRILNQNGLFVLSNCDPLQFNYRTASGEEIVFVPKDRQISLEEGLELARVEKIMERRGIWQPETVAYGKESLPYVSLVGGR